MIIDPVNQLSITSALAAQAKTASFNATGIDVSQFTGRVAVVLNVGAGSGTTPTLDVALQSGSLADGSNAVALSPAVSAVQVTTVAGLQILSFEQRAAAKYLKIVVTIGGTTPSFPIAIEVVGQKRNQP